MGLSFLWPQYLTVGKKWEKKIKSDNNNKKADSFLISIWMRTWQENITFRFYVEREKETKTGCVKSGKE